MSDLLTSAIDQLEVAHRRIDQLKLELTRRTTVTSDMIARALTAVHGDHYPSGMHVWEIEEACKDMKAALMEALK